MSGPGGMTTKRDQRRDARRQQYQQRQIERQRERTRQIRNKRIRQGSLIGGAVLLVVLVAVLLSVFVFHVGGSSPVHTPTQTPSHHGWLPPQADQALLGSDGVATAQEDSPQRFVLALDISLYRQVIISPQILQYSAV